MNNKMVLNIMITYFVILSIVLVFQIARLRNDDVSAPSNSGVVLTEDRLNNAVVFYNGSPIVLTNKKQMLLDRANPNYTPIIKDGEAYLPISFYSNIYGASVSYNNSNTSANIRLNNKALVLDSNEAMIIDSAKEEEVEEYTKPIVANNVVYVPAEIFGQAFDRNVYIYGNIGIISADEFTEEDNSFLDSLVTQFNNLPYVINEDNMKSIALITGDNPFVDVSSKISPYGNSGNSSAINVADAVNDSNIVRSNDYLFYGVKGKIVVMREYEGEIIKAYDIELPESIEIDELVMEGNRLIAAGTSLISDNSEEATGDNFDTSLNSIKANLYIYNIAGEAPMLEKSFSSFGYFKSMEISGDYIYMLSQNSVYGLYNNGSFSLPYYIEENVNNINYENIQYFPETGDDDYTLLSAVSISEPSKAANVKAFMGAGKNICLSNSNFYVAKNRNTAFGNYDNIENTYVYRFSINNGEINLSGTTNILGHLIDRYAISESNGYCMLVTQFTDKPSSNTACNVSVLNNNMEICGQANEIARGTEISSVVFTQDQVMLMPVERGGSIYSVDIQNPTKPIGKGALKLSTGNALVYNYDENHILYLDNGNDILKVTMADITNFDAPKILHRQELGSYPHISTTLLNNKNSFFFDSEKNAMYVPVVIYGEDDEVVFEGTYIYNVFTDEGINRIGEVSAEKYDKVYKFRGKVLLLSDKEAVITDVNDLSTIKIIEF